MMICDKRVQGVKKDQRNKRTSVCSEVADQANLRFKRALALRASEAWRYWGSLVGCTELPFSALFLSKGDSLFFICLGSCVEQHAPAGAIGSFHVPRGRIESEVFEVRFERVFEALFLAPACERFPVVSSPKSSSFGMRRVSILDTWPAHRSWAVLRMVGTLGRFARVRTSVSGMCWLQWICKMLRRQFRWNLFNFLSWRLYAVHDSAP